MHTNKYIHHTTKNIHRNFFFSLLLLLQVFILAVFAFDTNTMKKKLDDRKKKHFKRNSIHVDIYILCKRNHQLGIRNSKHFSFSSSSYFEFCLCHQSESERSFLHANLLYLSYVCCSNSQVTTDSYFICVTFYFTVVCTEHKADVWCNRRKKNAKWEWTKGWNHVLCIIFQYFDWSSSCSNTDCISTFWADTRKKKREKLSNNK